jgi:glucose 1-dehydrogenase
MYTYLFEEFGTIDILVAYAALQKESSLVKVSLAEWQFVLNVNLIGQFLCAPEAARKLYVAAQTRIARSRQVRSFA